MSAKNFHSTACKNPSCWVLYYAKGRAASRPLQSLVRGRDHMPPHVHVANNEGGESITHIGIDWVELKRRKRMSEIDANCAIRLVAVRLDLCLEIWKKCHP